MLDKDFLRRKIKLIQEELTELTKLKHLTFDELASDAIKYAAVERMLERIVTRAIDINQHLIAELGQGQESVRTYQSGFLELAELKILTRELAETIAPSAGLRNILVHEYDEVDQKLVYQSVKDALVQYTDYCREIIKLIA